MTDIADKIYAATGLTLGAEAAAKIGQMIQAENEKLRAALRFLVSSTYSHLDGRDLLGELHPRNTLDIKRRVDGVETWFEGDWLTDLMDARNIARVALGEKQ